MIPTLIMAIAIIGFFFAGLGIRILLVKNGEFKGSCASQSPFLKNQIGECDLCGKPANESECRKQEN